MTNDHAAEILRNRSASLQERIGAADLLRDEGSLEVVQTLIDVATSDSEAPALARAVGRAIGAISYRARSLHLPPLEAFSGDAYEGFDEQVALMMRANEP